jgi:hypothetical protein
MKKLGVVNICGIDYEVQEHSIEECPQLADAYSAIVHMQSLILIRKGLEPTLFRNAVMHEIQHGIWEHSGLRETTEALTDMKVIEETHIQIFTPHWIAALASMKKWRA